MGRGLPAYNEPIPPADELGGLDVEHTQTPGNVIHIDGRTGSVFTEKSDGSLEISGARRTAEEVDGGFDENLAERSDVPLQTIAARLLEGIRADIQSRADWEETANIGRELLGVKLEKASNSVTGEGTVSQVRHLGYLEAVIRSWANSRAELLPAGGPVKVADDQPEIVTNANDTGSVSDDPAAPPPTGAPPPKPILRSQLADALEKDMNHYLTVVDKEYVPDFSQMLINRAINGVQFRKIYECPIRRRPTSKWVKGADLIVSNDTAHLSGASRVTERIMTRQPIVKRMQAIGQWRKVELTMPNQVLSPTDANINDIQGTIGVPMLPEDQLHEIFECYCELDDGPLAFDENGDEPGWPLPYRVTIDKDSQTVLEIRRNWKEGDEDYTACRRYVKYGFVPGLGFYDWGLVHILGNPQRAATAIERMLIDAGMFASYPGGLIAQGPGSRQRINEFRPGPGQFVTVQTGGLPIDQVVMPLPYKEPSGVLQAMGGQIATDMRRLAGVMEMPVGEGRVGNVPVGTMMAYVDAITKVPSAIHKDDHAAQAEEFELLKELFVEDPEALTRSTRPRRRARAQGYTAEELDDQDLVPKSDPNVPSQTHRVMQVTALVEAAQSPLFQGIANPRGIWTLITQVLGVESTSDVTMPPQAPQPPPPDPRVQAAQINAAAKTQATNAQVEIAREKADQQSTQAMLEQQEKDADRQSEENRAAMKLKGDVVKAQAHVGTSAIGTVQKHAQHLNELAQPSPQDAEPATPAPEDGGQQ